MLRLVVTSRLRQGRDDLMARLDQPAAHLFGQVAEAAAKVKVSTVDEAKGHFKKSLQRLEGGRF
jgi:hypothetical protein